MKFGYSEDEVHAHIYAKGIEALIVDSKELDDALSVAMPVDEGDGQEGGEFAFWKIIKQRVLERIQRIHCSVPMEGSSGQKSSSQLIEVGRWSWICLAHTMTAYSCSS